MVVIDSFEDQDLSEYSTTSGYATSTTRAVDGSVAVKNTTQAPSKTFSFSGDGLNTYPSKDVILEYYCWIGDSPDQLAGFIFGAEASDTYYRVDLREKATEDEIRIIKSLNGSTTELAFTENFSANDGWNRVRITWGTSGDNIDAEVFDFGGSSTATVSATDGDVSGTGVGFQVGRNTTFIDWLRVEPRAPTGLSTSVSGDDITLSWSNQDPYDGLDILRAQSSGTTKGDYTTVASVSGSATSYTDSGLLDGERYYYRVAPQTSEDDSLSAEVNATTALPAPGTPSTSNITNDQTDLSWTASHDNGSTDVQFRRSSTAAWTTFSTVGRNTTAETLTGLLNGEEYDARVVATTPHATSASGTTTWTTTLPDEDTPTLLNGVEDEVGIDRGAQTTDYGDIRLQIRETGETSWSASAVGFAEQVIDHATLSTQFTGREDGEEYEVRARSETEHVTGAWTSPVDIVTLFPGASNLTVVSASLSGVDLSWTDNADNETGFEVQRQKELASGATTAFTTLATLSSNTTTYTDTDTLQPNRTYTYRIRAFTDDTDALSGTVSTTPDTSAVRQRRVPSQGWYVEIDTN